MPDTEPFPWDLLKAECLRLVCSQLVQGSEEGGHYPGNGRKEEMINFLRDVEAVGLEPAIKKIDTTTTPRKVSAGSENTESAKRKSSRLEASEEEGGAEEEGESSDLTHNTRYKGAKRVKLAQDDKETSASANPAPRKSGPGRPRKSTEGASASAADGVKRGRGRPRKSDATTKDNEGDAVDSATPKKARGRPKTAPPTDENGVPIKRGRGRPRKNASGGEGTASASGAAAPSSKGKSVFDGVILNKRRPSVQGETSAEGQAAQQQSAVTQGDAAEEDVVLAVINGQGIADASSLGGPLPANGPNSMNIDDDHDADADADGDPDPQVAITA